MNFIPCRLENGGGSLNVRLTDQLAFPVPPARAAAIAAMRANGKLLLGLRPEHITEAGQHMEPGEVPFDADLDVTEPMGMETLVYFPLNGIAGLRPGQSQRRRQRRRAAAAGRRPQQHAPDRRGDRQGHLGSVAHGIGAPSAPGPNPADLVSRNDQSGRVGHSAKPG